MFPVSDQRVQGAGLFPVDKELDLLTDLHTETDLGEGCVPVGRQLGLLSVKSSLASWKIVTICAVLNSCSRQRFPLRFELLIWDCLSTNSN